MHNITLDDLSMYFRFLDRLREMGSINMFGAPPVLEKVYHLSKQDARKIWSSWASSFTEDKTPDERAKEVKQAYLSQPA